MGSNLTERLMKCFAFKHKDKTNVHGIDPKYESILSKLYNQDELFDYIIVPVNLGDDKDEIINWIEKNLKISKDIVVGVWTTYSFNDKDENAESWILVKSNNLPKLTYINYNNDQKATYRYSDDESPASRDHLVDIYEKRGLDGYVEGLHWITINDI